MIRVALQFLVISLSFVCASCMQAEGDASLNRELFANYIDAFQNRDFEALATTFYSDDMTVTVGDAVLDVEGILEFERSLVPLMDFTFDIRQLVVDENGIAFDGFENITILQDSDNPLVGPAVNDEKWQVHLNVFYTVSRGKISEIRVNVVSASRRGQF